MRQTRHFHTGEAALVELVDTEDGNASLPEHKDEARAAIATLRSWYLEGRPFFTKARLRQAQQELARVDALYNPGAGDGDGDDDEERTKARAITLEGLNGKPIRFESELGHTKPAWGEEGREYVIYKPILYYTPIQALLDHTHWSFVPRLAWCNLTIHYSMQLRDTATGQIVSEEDGDLSREEAEEFFAAVRQHWEASRTCRQLRAALAPAASRLRVGKVVAFACNSFARGYSQKLGDARPDYAASGMRAAYQHALALTLRDVFSRGGRRKGDKKDGGPEVDAPLCYAQDPAYIDIDEQVLGTHGMTVLEDPSGFLEVDESSVVISCAPNVPVKQVVWDVARPAVLIWDTVEEDQCDAAWTDPDTPRIAKDIGKLYQIVEFPGGCDDLFSGITVYVRRY